MSRTSRRLKFKFDIYNIIVSFWQIFANHKNNTSFTTRLFFFSKVVYYKNFIDELKSKNEIRIGALFKKSPEAFLEMIVVHELAHLKEKNHNKNFYKLCQHMQADYHQIELDLRIYLTQIELFGDIYN